MSLRRRRMNAPYGVAVTPATPTVEHPGTQQMTVAVTNVHGDALTDARADGTWTSSDTAVATVDAAGLVTTVAAGTCEIQFTAHNNVQDATPATLTVTNLA
jgi:uncharacterized protein YjdB